MSIVINDDNLLEEEINTYTNKVRALLISDNQILIAPYANIILLPGGGVEKDEKIEDAIIRELKEETGENYTFIELEYLNTVMHYQRNYPKRKEGYHNRLLTTHYFIGEYKGITKNNQALTISEQNNNFRLELVSLDELESIINNNQNDNPRYKYFSKELLLIIEEYKKTKGYVKKKKI